MPSTLRRKLIYAAAAAACVALLTAMGGIARADVITGYEQQSTQLLVGAGGFNNVLASCSTGNKVLSGGFSLETPDDVKVFSSYPDDGSSNASDRSWDAFVQNAGTAGRQVTTTVICVSPTIAGYEQQSNQLVVGAGAFNNVPASCSPGNKVVGGGFSIETPVDVKVFSSEPNDGNGNSSDSAWNTFVQNAGTAARQVTTTAICVSPTIEGYEQRSNRLLVGAGASNNVPASCSPGGKVLGGGFSLETPVDVKLFSSEPSDGNGNTSDSAWNTLVENAGTADRQVTTTAICVSPTIAEAPPPPPPPPPKPKTLADLPVPDLGVEANIEPVAGTVLIGIPTAAASVGGAARASQKGIKFVPLKEAQQVPIGSFLDTRKGTVRLQNATAAANKTQQGTFTRGLFQVLQSRKKRAKGLTDLVLKGANFNSCKPKRGKRAQAALSRKALRRLSGNARGRYRTRGRYGAATVRGTKWTVTDRCDGTLTKVTRGKVAVRDFRRKKTILVKAGKSYLARAPAD